jgi:acyl dehydratase
LITIEQLREELVGQEFSPGEFTIPDWEHWLCADAVHSPPLPDDLAHPMYGYYAALVGMAPSVDDIFKAAHSSAEEGPMFGEASLEFQRPLRVGSTYRIEGGFTGVERKESRRLGFMDLVTFEVQLIEDDGEVAAISRNTFVFPRGSE